jgi:pyruvate formate lyase activating enzyme
LNQHVMTKGLVFDVRKYSIHDGPGIRTTVFFKGCPLRCLWCHNPEGQSFKPELIIRAGRCLKDCSDCLVACEATALAKVDGIPVLDQAKCTACGNCAAACPTLAVEMVGRLMEVSEIMAAIDKDRIFLDESGGGVTFSGGEPLAQPSFLMALLTECQKKGIHTTLDTCGFAPRASFEKIIDKVGLFHYDLKLMDPQKHRMYTGEPSGIILENLKRLSEENKKIVIRLPVVPGINDDEDNLSQMADFLRSLKTVTEISLLPFHKMAKEKYRGLQKQNPSENLSPPSAERLEKIKGDLTSFGFTVYVGE